MRASERNHAQRQRTLELQLRVDLSLSGSAFFFKQPKGIFMNYSIVASAGLAALVLSACDRQPVVVPVPVVTTVPVPGPAGPTGAAGATGWRSHALNTNAANTAEATIE